MTDIQQLIRELNVSSDTKIVMVVADGLGGLPMTPDGRTELETANTPNLDALAERGIQGGSIPVLPGITPGSGPGHFRKWRSGQSESVVPGPDPENRNWGR